MKPLYLIIGACLACSIPIAVNAQTTSWTGTSSTAWRNAANWTAGIPTSAVNVVIGDANFTGSFQPSITSSAAAKTVTLGGVKASTLTISKNLTVAGDVTITSNGTIAHGKGAMTLSGNWSNSGTYTASNNNSNIVFAGAAQTLGGTNVTSFRKLTINAGSTVTLARNVTVSGGGSTLNVKGTLNPGESPTYLVTASSITVAPNAILKVNATTFAGNYSVTPTLNAGSTVEYSAAGNQTVSNSLTYSTLRISGSGVKSLAGNLPSLVSSATTAGNIYVAAGTLDLLTFTANRGTTTTGGDITVLNNATLKIGGTNTFPANYATRTLSLTSTVEYSGNNQTVQAFTYGNLTLSGTSGAVVKTMPGAAFTVAGNLVSTVGAATSLSFTAAAALTVSGNTTIGTATTFNGGSFTHTLSGNWTNNGTFTGSTSTITMAGGGATISGTGSNNFNNLTFTASNISASAATSLNIGGNLATTGPGIFTHASGGTTTLSGASKTISGTGITFDNLTVSGSVSTASAFNITGNLIVSGSLSSSAGIITMSGTSKTISGTGTKSFYSLAIPGSVTISENASVSSALDVTGSFTATANTITFTGTSSLNGTANLFNVTLNGTSLQLASNAVLGIAGAYTVTAGTLNVSSTLPNTVNFNGTGAQTVTGGTYHHLTVSNGNTKTPAAAITTNGDLTIAASTTFSAGGFTHTVNGNWNNNGVFTAGGSTIVLAGNTNTTLSGTNTFNILTLNKSTAVSAVSLLNNANVATLNMTSGQLLTGSSTVNITGNRTGTGIILGNIQRTHTFTAGTAYAFESPENTVTFTSITTAVPSVTVSVTKAPISDFPFGSSLNRQYTITIPSGAYTAALRLHYEDEELNGNNESTMSLWDNPGASWVSGGKTSNNTGTNYVELTGLSNIAARWTLSDASNVTRWTGAVSNDWNTAGNWTVIAGAPGAIPTANDVVQLGAAAFTNQPAISSAAVAKSIQFGSAQAVTLTLNAGGTLNVAGNISGEWSSNATHTINAGAETLTVNGDLLLSDGVAGHAINLTASSATADVKGSVSQSGGANIAFSGTGILSVGNNFNYTNGSFNAGTGTVQYTGTNVQTTAPVAYHNLVVNKPGGTASINNASTIAGNLTIQSGTLDINAATTVTGNIVINTGAVLNGKSATINVAGNWSNSGSFNAGTGTVQLNGPAGQSVSASSFNNFIVNKPSGTASLSGNITINNNLSVTAGTLDAASFTASRSLFGGTFSMATGTSFVLAGASNFPSNYSTYDLAATSSVNYNGNSAQTVAGIPYGNLVFNSGGSKTLSAPATVKGDITINSGASFDAGAHTLSLTGNWTNNGIFIPSTSTLLLNGAGKTISGATTFNKITVYGSYTVNNSNITYNGLLNVTSTGSYDAGTGTAIVNGDLTNSGSLSSGGTTTFSGTSLQTIRFLNAILSNSSGIINFNGNVSPVLNSTSTPTFANLNINNTAGINPSVNWLILGAFNIGTGAIFNGGAPTHTIRGNFTNNGTVTSSGTLNFNPITTSAINFGSAFSSTGTVILSGAGAITLAGTPSSLFHVEIENTNAAGVTPASGWTINGHLIINNNSILHAGSGSFTVAGDIESNGTLDGGTSTFTMTSPAGILSGSAGTAFYNFTVGGSVIANSDFQVTGNFTNNGTFDATIGELIMSGSTPGIIGGTTNPSTIAQMSINKSAGVTVTMARNITTITSLHINKGILDASTFTLTQDAVNLGELFIEDTAVLKIGGTNTLPVFNTYSLDTLSTVDYAGSTQSIPIIVNYGNLTISAAGTKTPAGALTILHDFTLMNGNFAGGNFTHLLSGDWNMSSGTFTNTGTTIQLNGVDSQFLSSTGAFSNLTVNKASGQALLAGNIAVNNALTFTSGKLFLLDKNLTIGNTGVITGASSANYVVADSAGTLVQQVVNGNSKSFPVGTEANYIPATVALTAGSTTDQFAVHVMEHVYSNGTTGFPISVGAVDATWLIEESVAGGSDGTLTVQWPGVLELPSFDRSVTRLAHYIGPWEYGTVNLSASGSDPYTLTRSGFTSFSPFAVSFNEALPVTWLGVEGKNIGRDNLISWSTATELNNAYFAVEVSADAANFTEIGRVPGANNSTYEHHYTFLHKNVPYTQAWYRIKQVDANGQFSYSKVVQVNMEAITANGLIYVTNPVRDKATAVIHAERPYATTLSLFNATGKMVSRQAVKMNAGVNITDISLAGYAQGIYILQFVDESGNKQSVKLLKQ